LVIESTLELVYNSDGLAGTSGTNEHRVLSIKDKGSHQFVHTDGINSGDDQLGVSHILGDNERWEGLKPVDPSKPVTVEVEVEETLVLSKFNTQFLDFKVGKIKLVFVINIFISQDILEKGIELWS